MATCYIEVLLYLHVDFCTTEYSCIKMLMVLEDSQERREGNVKWVHGGQEEKNAKPSK